MDHMNVSLSFIESVGQALAEPESMGSLRIFANRQLAKGTSRETLAMWFELARERFPAHEDRLLEVLDLVADWCSPNQRLQEPIDRKECGEGPVLPGSRSGRPLETRHDG